MYRYPPNLRRLDPLPESFEPSLSAVDELLAESARMDEVPTSVSSRVYEASVRLLPETVEVTSVNQRLRFVRPTKALWHRTPWARLAMAACVAIACTAAILTWQSQTPMPTNRTIQPIMAYAEPVHYQDVADDLEQFPRDFTSHIESDIAYLLDTNDVDSFEDITAELALLVSAMEL